MSNKSGTETLKIPLSGQLMAEAADSGNNNLLHIRRKLGGFKPRIDE